MAGVISAESVDGILGEAVSALTLLRSDVLEELERRLVELVSSGGVAIDVCRLRPKLDLLEACVVRTGNDLMVLRRLLRQEGRA